MRKFYTLILVFVLIFSAVPAFSQDVDDDPDNYLATSMYDPGNIALSATVGFGYGFSLALYPGAEVIVLDTMIGDAIPFSLGVAARGMFNFVNNYTAFGVGAFVGAHISFNELEPDAVIGFLENFDFYTMIGLAVNFYSYDFGYTGDSFNTFGFATIGGFNYFFSDTFALKIEGNYWSYMGGASIGVLFKL
ncbi:MAG: hypothetical protein ACLFSE_09390 [Spirochaetia bacterium]